MWYHTISWTCIKASHACWIPLTMFVCKTVEPDLVGKLITTEVIMNYLVSCGICCFIYA